MDGWSDAVDWSANDDQLWLSQQVQVQVHAQQCPMVMTTVALPDDYGFTLGADWWAQSMRAQEDYEFWYEFSFLSLL